MNQSTDTSSQDIVQQPIEEPASKVFAGQSKVYQRSAKLRALWRESAIHRTEDSDRILLDFMMINKEDNLLIPPSGGAYVPTSQSDMAGESNQAQSHFVSGIEEYEGDVIQDFTQLTGNRPDAEEENIGLLEHVPDLVTYYFQKIMEGRFHKESVMPLQERPILALPTVTDGFKQDLIDGQREDESENWNPTLIGNLLKCQFSAELSELEQSAIMDLASSMTEEELHRNQDLAMALFHNALGAAHQPTRKRGNSHNADKKLKTLSMKRHTSIKKVSDRIDLQGGIPPSPLQLSKVYLSFRPEEDGWLTPGTSASEMIEIKTKAKKHIQFKVIVPERKRKAYEIGLSTTYGEVKKGQSTKLKVELKLLSPVYQVTELLFVEAIGGARYAIFINAQCEVRKFGVDPNEMTMTYVEGIGDIPSLLHVLRGVLLRHDGQRKRGIFRESGNGRLIREYRSKLSTDKFTDCDDVHIVSNLIKSWFREMPKRLFDSLDLEEIMSVDPGDAEQCEELVGKLEGLDRRLFDWLLDLMLEIEQHKEVNMMPAHNIAIVFSPNLYSSEGFNNPAMIFALTDRLSKVIETLILKKRTEEMAKEVEHRNKDRE